MSTGSPAERPTGRATTRTAPGDGSLTAGCRCADPSASPTAKSSICSAFGRGGWGRNEVGVHVPGKDAFCTVQTIFFWEQASENNPALGPWPDPEARQGQTKDASSVRGGDTENNANKREFAGTRRLRVVTKHLWGQKLYLPKRSSLKCSKNRTQTTWSQITPELKHLLHRDGDIAQMRRGHPRDG